VDEAFGKGSTSYDRCNGDPAHAPNPCLGPIDRPPYCAVKVQPTPLGTSVGVRTDERARALDEAGQPIEGLYAVGNDMQSVMGGEYPGAGAQIGVAMTFGWIAAKHAAEAAAQAAVTRRPAAAGSAAFSRSTT
jgi:succinate dehydrogenase/fumarate reductase flavoprotein subunit